MTEGIFLRRPNRFIAEVMVDGRLEKAHVKNTGRCRELLLEGVPVLLEPSGNPSRKTKYSLINVMKNGQWVNMDSAAPNVVVEEMVREGRLFSDVTRVRREKTFRHSRFDLYVETGTDPARRIYIEVKGVTLEEEGVARFPDAPTERGLKHIRELEEAVREGYEAWIVFVIQMKGVTRMEPNMRTQPAFGEALVKAREAGVRLAAFDCIVKRESLKTDRPIPVDLGVVKRRGRLAEKEEKEEKIR